MKDVYDKWKQIIINIFCFLLYIVILAVGWAAILVSLYFQSTINNYVASIPGLYRLTGQMTVIVYYIVNKLFPFLAWLVIKIERWEYS